MPRSWRRAGQRPATQSCRGLKPCRCLLPAAALAGHDAIVAEAEGHVGAGTSSRNSEVIHAGLYYPTGSLRERHCARSRRMLYDYCASRGVPHKKLGKLVVVNRDADIAALEKLFAQATRNGVEGLCM